MFKFLHLVTSLFDSVIGRDSSVYLRLMMWLSHGSCPIAYTYGTSDAADLSALLTLDSENSQVFTAYANRGSSGATVWVANEEHQNVVMSR